MAHPTLIQSTLLKIINAFVPAPCSRHVELFFPSTNSKIKCIIFCFANQEILVAFINNRLCMRKIPKTAHHK